MTASYIGFNKPTIKELYESVISDINTALPGQDASLKNSPLNILATVQVGLTQQLYHYLDWISNQTNILYADGQNLDIFGKIWSIQRLAATKSKGTASFSGLAGYFLPVGTKVQTNTGIQYSVDSEVELTTTSGICSLTSINPGPNNLSAGTTLTLVNPVAGISSSLTVISITGGDDIEDDEHLRTRILNRISNPPFGGSAQDYLTWTLAQPNVTRAWVSPLEDGPGTVTVRFAMDNLYTHGIPQSGDVDDIQAAINLVRPITAIVTVAAPITQTINIEVTDLFPNTITVQNAVRAELESTFLRTGKPGGTIYLSDIWQAVSLATGTQSHKITSPTDNIIIGSTALPIVGTLNFV
jgi:uncharacterized phage protein gp47/JayE